ncbi:hypothetical protein M407DRAFT_24911 [Tulasnella calospora MUT 4182]|uniref:FAD-binding PCMH-type domain-containing protein n=1 Tax=Tulasnella calospora MUT 4182 TaxID=1051891 RepID=A0A0C3KWB9_9AGAM|nr:hypothetical protein M407DRAFT_24911 [Tulasnella calospora MUT 4182]
MLTRSIGRLRPHVVRPLRQSALIGQAQGRKLSTLNKLEPKDVEHFATILPKTSILSTLPPIHGSADDLDPFNSDWMGKYVGQSQCVLKPRTTEEVSKIMKWCWERRIPVVPQGGNTGLVGGSVPIGSEVILNLSNMNKIRTFDPISGILVCDAGCILESLSEFLDPHKHIMPLDLGAKGSCQIGGNVSTNAGGLRLLRYGSLHGTVLGLEVVLPDGRVMDQLTTLRKDNTGYDLKQLFIGAEGTLGVVTGVSILTPAAPMAQQAIFLALPSFATLPKVYRAAKRHLSEIISAFEYFDRQSYNLVSGHTGAKALEDSEIGDSQAFVLIETSGGDANHDQEKVNNLLEELYEPADGEEALINSGALSQSADQFASLWAFREGIAEAAGKSGKVYKYDISVPVSEFVNTTNRVRERVGHKVKEVVGYGHVGDGNLHINVIAETYTKEIEELLEPFIYEVVASHRGSISAEHGIGKMKPQHLHYSKDAVSIDLMKKIKQLFDERGIMNPGKVVPM